MLALHVECEDLQYKRGKEHVYAEFRVVMAPTAHFEQAPGRSKKSERETNT